MIIREGGRAVSVETVAQSIEANKGEYTGTQVAHILRQMVEALEACRKLPEPVDTI
jgi:hypothetical protein